jgi:hypothetical protein
VGGRATQAAAGGSSLLACFSLAVGSLGSTNDSRQRSGTDDEDL